MWLLKLWPRDQEHQDPLEDGQTCGVPGATWTSRCRLCMLTRPRKRDRKISFKHGGPISVTSAPAAPLPPESYPGGGRLEVRVTEVSEERQVEQKDGSEASLRLEKAWRAGKGGREADGIGVADR